MSTYAIEVNNLRKEFQIKKKTALFGREIIEKRRYLSQ